MIRVDEFRTHGDDSAVDDMAPLPPHDVEAGRRRFRAALAELRRRPEAVT